MSFWNLFLFHNFFVLNFVLDNCIYSSASGDGCSRARHVQRTGEKSALRGFVTHFRPMFLLYVPWKHQKYSCVLAGGLAERHHWHKMGYVKTPHLLLNFDWWNHYLVIYYLCLSWNGIWPIDWKPRFSQ